MAGRSEVRIPVEARDFSLTQNVQTTPSVILNWNRCHSLELERLGREGKHQPRYSVARMSGNVLLLPLHPFMAWTERSLPLGF